MPEIDSPTDISAYLPGPMQIAEGCVWETKELEVFENPKAIVTFRYANCEYDEGTNFNVSNNGTRVQKAYYDVINDSFYIFDRTDGPINEFIEELPIDIHSPGENCEPRQISDRFWIIDDGLTLDAEINELPCGSYGRNFGGQKIFEIRNEFILNYQLVRNPTGIDYNSILLEKSP